MDIISLLNDYKTYVTICSNIDYSNKKTIRENNKAVKKMYSILNQIKSEDPSLIEHFYCLLDNEDTGKWFSHQLLELFEVNHDTEKKALYIIK